MEEHTLTDNDNDRNLSDEAWIAKYLSNETTTVNTRDLYCAMLHLLCYRADLLREETIDYFLVCELCKLRNIECAKKHRQHINNIALKVGLYDNALILLREYRVHSGLEDDLESQFRKKVFND